MIRFVSNVFDHFDSNIFKFCVFSTDIATAYFERLDCLVTLWDVQVNKMTIVFITNIKFPTDYFLLVIDPK